MRKILPLLFFWIFWSCQTNPYESIETTYDDGLPELVKIYKSKDKKVLLSETHYYPGNKKKMEGSFKNNLRDGTWSYWYENGNLWSRADYSDGIEIGIKTIWHENGQKYYEGYINDGVRSGIWNFWDENGDQINRVNYDE